MKATMRHHVAGQRLGAILYLLLPLLLAARTAPLAAPLPTLTSAYQAHSLTGEQAALRYPVRLRATVTYYDPYIDPRHAALFVADASGAIFVSLPATPILPLQPGTIVDLSGVSGQGDFAPIITDAKIRVIGQGSIPVEPRRVGLTLLLTGRKRPMGRGRRNCTVYRQFRSRRHARTRPERWQHTNHYA